MPQSVVAPATERRRHTKVVQVGIIGYGKMGQIRCDVISQNGAGRVVAICDPVPQPPRDGIRRCASPQELIADPEVEAVFICTPNYLNQPLTIQALQAGKHVFCEKPPALNARQMEEVVAVEAAAGGRKLMYGFNHRHHDSVKKAKELIDSGLYGRMLWMRGRYGKSVDESFYQTWRAKRALAGGGILIDQGIHMLDLFLMLAGEFDEVQAFVSNLYWKLDVEDNVFATLRNREGIIASLHSTMTQWRHLFSLEIFLERGYLVLNGLLTSSGTYGEEVLTLAKNRTTAPAATWEDEEHIRFSLNLSWRHEVDQFFEAILSDRPVEAGTSQDALKLMRLIDKIYESDRGARHG